MDNGSYSSSSGGKKSHKVLYIILGIVIVLIGVGLLGYFINKHNQKKTATSSTSTVSNQPSSSTKTFAPAVNSNQPYSATITSSVNGQPTSATMISDGKGSYSYTYKANGKTVSTIYTPDAYYLCSGTTACLKYTTTASKSGFDPSTYQYDSTKLESLKSTAAYKGQQTCPGGTGTCEVWSVTSSTGNTTTTFYVDTATKRIAKATVSNGTTSSDITYEYKSVHIAVPTNYTAAPTQ